MSQDNSQNPKGLIVARTVHHQYAVAICPQCGAEIDVPLSDFGEMECICNTVYHWSTLPPKVKSS
ncbi:hypothetical protein [Vibrio barjaei]|uniref:hypothetical protein n=1 Tax=Vibrio barjaei TaxID=1676683 RepID=UPI0022852E03|nr:hypothetical protein [Vibrio barjaei]MCY9872365.1 hypothetical protein [Vibrio barjaei]